MKSIAYIGMVYMCIENPASCSSKFRPSIMNRYTNYTNIICQINYKFPNSPYYRSQKPQYIVVIYPFCSGKHNI